MSRARILADYVSSGDELADKAPIASPTFTGTVAGVTATHVGLGNVTNESKATMFTSPTLTGTTTFSGDIVPSTPLSHRNMIINGGMQVSQRGSSISFAHDGKTNDFTLDRFRLVINNTDQFDCTLAQHSMTSAELNTTGFAKSLILTTGTAESAIDANETLYLTQKIEAQNLQHLLYGTASAKTITLSFWVKTSVTGTYGISLYKPDTTGRIINATYTTSGTGWEYKTITIAGDTDSGATIVNDNGDGLWVIWHLASGSDYDSSPSTSWANYASTNWAGNHAQDGITTTASATFYLTGVQLELGSNATPFEHRSFGEVLAMCQRYYYLHCEGNGKNMGGHGSYYNANEVQWTNNFPCTMRAAPTLDYVTGTGYWTCNGQGADAFNALALQHVHTNSTNHYATDGVSGAGGQHSNGRMETSHANAKLGYTAEL